MHHSISIHQIHQAFLQSRRLSEAINYINTNSETTWTTAYIHLFLSQFNYENQKLNWKNLKKLTVEDAMNLYPEYFDSYHLMVNHLSQNSLREIHKAILDTNSKRSAEQMLLCYPGALKRIGRYGYDYTTLKTTSPEQLSIELGKQYELPLYASKYGWNIKTRRAQTKNSKVVNTNSVKTILQEINAPPIEYLFEDRERTTADINYTEYLFEDKAPIETDVNYFETESASIENDSKQQFDESWFSVINDDFLLETKYQENINIPSTQDHEKNTQDDLNQLDESSLFTNAQINQVQTDLLPPSSLEPHLPTAIPAETVIRDDDSRLLAGTADLPIVPPPIFPSLRHSIMFTDSEIGEALNRWMEEKNISIDFNNPPPLKRIKR
ncbi:MAG: hypothetical protein A3F12_04775 [Gammaproteobacteria bacterium RIFCSPHIGHO2_12_FULL_38_14]|nr:MAG: hypothetical protein A3F12_04775 [Gammaproteobacteria bacterium RIFCSPHIGHO2_12_FULL_38_14]